MTKEIDKQVYTFIEKLSKQLLDNASYAYSKYSHIYTKGLEDGRVKAAQEIMAIINQTIQSQCGENCDCG